MLRSLLAPTRRRLASCAHSCATQSSRRFAHQATAVSGQAQTPTQAQSARPTRIVSGIQPSGVLHLGNYLGAVQSWVQLQNGSFKYPSAATSTGEAASAQSSPSASADAASAVAQSAASANSSSSLPSLYLFLADWHALTVRPHPSELRASCLQLTAQLLACGIDENRAVLFQQSHVREHVELAWIFTCLTPFTRLQAMTQFKEKAAKLKDSGKGPGGQEAQTASLGLFSYPVLQAADILLYQADAVPVGQDQFQHVELCRDIATFFNTHARSTHPAQSRSRSTSSSPSSTPTSSPPVFQFPLPTHLSTPTARILSLKTGTGKMSKSDASAASRIDLMDEQDVIARKIKKSITDSVDGPLTYDEEQRPQVANLLRILSAMTDRTVEELLADASVTGNMRVMKGRTD